MMINNYFLPFSQVVIMLAEFVCSVEMQVFCEQNENLLSKEQL